MLVNRQVNHGALDDVTGEAHHGCRICVTIFNDFNGFESKSRSGTTLAQEHAEGFTMNRIIQNLTNNLLLSRSSLWRPPLRQGTTLVQPAAGRSPGAGWFPHSAPSRPRMCCSEDRA
jgi:hypothetical protein